MGQADENWLAGQIITFFRASEASSKILKGLLFIVAILDKKAWFVKSNYLHEHSIALISTPAHAAARWTFDSEPKEALVVVLNYFNDATAPPPPPPSKLQKYYELVS